jgi:Mce-associated membrane protein
VLAIAVGFLLVQLTRANAEASARVGALSSARQLVADLTTVRSNDPHATIQRVLNETTGGFHDEFSQQSDAFTAVVNQGKVTSNGSAAEAGIETVDEHQATVLVAIKGDVTNVQSATPQPRQYRVRVTLQHQGRAWLASKVEFVP